MGHARFLLNILREASIALHLDERHVSIETRHLVVRSRAYRTRRTMFKDYYCNVVRPIDQFFKRSSVRKAHKAFPQFQTFKMRLILAYWIDSNNAGNCLTAISKQFHGS
jgi:hypothetical protein